jgi:hypothetical protein
VVKIPLYGMINRNIVQLFEIGKARKTRELQIDRSIERVQLSNTDRSISTGREQMSIAGQIQLTDTAHLGIQKTTARMFTVEAMNHFTAV